VDPFIGLIDSPFDSSNISKNVGSKFSWFFVESPQTMRKGMNVNTNMITDKEIPQDVMERIQELTKTKDTCSSKAVNFKDIWCDVPEFGPMSYLEKLRRSLELLLHCPPEEKMDVIDSMVHNLK